MTLQRSSSWAINRQPKCTLVSMTEVSTRLEEKFRALNSAIKLYRWVAETTTKDPNNSKTKFWNYLSLPPIWYISPVFQFCGWSSWTRGTEWSSWTSRLSFTFKSIIDVSLFFILSVTLIVVFFRTTRVSWYTWDWPRRRLKGSDAHKDGYRWTVDFE